MLLGEKLITGRFIKRPNRFLALVRVGNRVFRSFLPNPGRLSELLIPGAKVMLSLKERAGRKTAYDLVAVYKGDLAISIDSRLPNGIVYEALSGKRLPRLAQYTTIVKEHPYKASRFDFYLSNESGGQCFIEVKSCTLVKRGRALFPDAPTERGRRHLVDLIEAVGEGFRGCIIFIVQRPDASVFSPNEGADPRFGATLRRAFEEGVEVYAYRCMLNGAEIALDSEIAVELEAKHDR